VREWIFRCLKDSVSRKYLRNGRPSLPKSCCFFVLVLNFLLPLTIPKPHYHQRDKRHPMINSMCLESSKIYLVQDTGLLRGYATLSRHSQSLHGVTHELRRWTYLHQHILVELSRCLYFRAVNTSFFLHSNSDAQSNVSDCVHRSS